MNKILWSRSRDNTLRACLKKYYLQYINQSENPEFLSMRNLKSKFLLRSFAVRNTLFNLITDYIYGFEIHLNEYLTSAVRELSLAVKTEPLLVEKYYNRNSFNADVFYLELELMIKNFYNSEIFNLIKTRQPADIVIPSLENNMNSFNFLDFTIMFKPDLIIKNQNDFLIVNLILNGDSDNIDDYFQLTAALSFLYCKSIEKSARINIAGYFLKENRKIELPGDSPKINDKISYLKNSITAMLQYQNLNDAQNFPETNDNTKCSLCNYRKICINSD